MCKTRSCEKRKFKTRQSGFRNFVEPRYQGSMYISASNTCMNSLRELLFSISGCYTVFILASLSFIIVSLYWLSHWPEFTQWKLSRCTDHWLCWQKKSQWFIYLSISLPFSPQRKCWVKVGLNRRKKQKSFILASFDGYLNYKMPPFVNALS